MNSNSSNKYSFKNAIIILIICSTLIIIMYSTNYIDVGWMLILVAFSIIAIILIINDTLKLLNKPHLDDSNIHETVESGLSFLEEISNGDTDVESHINASIKSKLNKIAMKIERNIAWKILVTILVYVNTIVVLEYLSYNIAELQNVLVLAIWFITCVLITVYNIKIVRRLRQKLKEIRSLIK